MARRFNAGCKGTRKQAPQGRLNPAPTHRRVNRAYGTCVASCGRIPPVNCGLFSMVPAGPQLGAEMRKPKSRTRPPSQSPSFMPQADAEQQLESFLAKYDPEVATFARRALTKMRRLVPGAIEMVYDNFNWLVIGFSPTERASEAIFSLVLS